MQRAPHIWRGRAARWRLGASVVVLASGCAALEPEVTEAPSEASATPASLPERIELPEPGDEVAAHFQALEAQRLSNDLLRREPAPRDVPFSVPDVEDMFVEIALFDEYVFEGGRIIERATPSRLRRWDDPVRMQMIFGDSVPAEMRRADRALVSRYARRLGSLTGHPVSVVNQGGNFHVLVLNEAERRAIGPQMRRLVPGIDTVTLELVETLPLSVSCLVLAFSRSGTDVYTDAIAIIRAELPEISREACYFEELAQGLGLPNDSPRARPSLFNDTAEFAVLTALDEQLLRILYDSRLEPGMREPEARPIVRQIAQELMGGAS